MAASLSTAIMTHPKRLARAEALRRRLTGLDASIVVDPQPDGPPSALRAARAAWAAAPADGTHHLVLQEDVDVPADFGDRVRILIEARPADPIALMVEWGAITAAPVRIAALHGAGWTPAVDSYSPTCGLILPTALALNFDAFASTVDDRAATDDTAMAAYLASLGATAMVAVPNIVEHDTLYDPASLAGNTAMGPRRAAGPYADPASCDVDLSRTVPVPSVLPYFCWWMGEAVALHADPGSAEGWRRTPLTSLLALHGCDLPAADDLIRPALRLGRAYALRLGIRAALLREAGLAALALGMTAAANWPAGRDADAALASRTAVDALTTLAPGGLRRLVEPPLLGPASEALRDLVLESVRIGLHRVR